MRHFNNYQIGAPFPGVCALCGAVQDLWDTGAEHARGGSFMICTRCISELAENIQYGPRAPYEEKLGELKAEINKLTEMLDRIPAETEGLINGVRSRVAEFVFAVAGGSSSDNSAVVENNEESSGAEHESDQSAELIDQTPSESAFVKRTNGVSTANGSKRTNSGK